LILSRRLFEDAWRSETGGIQRRMLMTNYADASLTYDNTRTSDEGVVDLLARKFDFRSGVPFLDFGCGTGNYLTRICARFGVEGYGTEPNDYMRRIAVSKNPVLEVHKGNHTDTGFPDGMFGLVYMTEVIHHVPDIGALFETLFASLKPGGLVAILTESHEQIGTRWFNKYFPSLAENEIARYPDLAGIENAAREAGFIELSRDVKAIGPVTVTENFIRTVREKNFSMFRELDEDEFDAGLAAIEKD
jgi:SAM-dependent methyltransferase